MAIATDPWRLKLGRLVIVLYFWNILISLDQLLNTILGGWPDESLSSRMGKKIEKGECMGCYYLCKFLSLLDWTTDKHCLDNIERDEGGRSN